MKSSRHRRLIAQIAMLAMLAGALMPSFGQLVLRSADPERWTEICTAEGMILLALTPGREDGSSEGDGVPTAERCPFCLPFGGQAVLAAEAVPPLPVCTAEELCPIAPSAALPGPGVWLAAYGRGPPALI